MRTVGVRVMRDVIAALFGFFRGRAVSWWSSKEALYNGSPDYVAAGLVMFGTASWSIMPLILPLDSSEGRSRLYRLGGLAVTPALEPKKAAQLTRLTHPPECHLYPFSPFRVRPPQTR